MIQQLKTGRKLASLFTVLSLLLIAVFYVGRHAAQASTAPRRSRWRCPRFRVATRGSASSPGRACAKTALAFVQVLRDGGRVELTPRSGAAASRRAGAGGVALAVRGGGGALGRRRGAWPGDGGPLDDRAGQERGRADLEAVGRLRQSIFKLVTASALVESGAVERYPRSCYHDGVHSVETSNLTAASRAGTRPCQTLAFGVAKSQNAIIARLAPRSPGADRPAAAGACVRLWA